MEPFSNKRRCMRRQVLMGLWLVSLVPIMSLTVRAEPDLPSNPDIAVLTEGEGKVDAYLQEQGMEYTKGSQEYNQFLNEVLNDHHSDLISNEEIDPVTLYAVSSLELKQDTETPTALWAKTYLPLSARSSNGTVQESNGTSIDRIDPKNNDGLVQPSLWVYYDRWAARNYTYQYTSYNGGTSRNGAYPDFSGLGGGGDCTNLISQALRAGGINMSGGGVCRYEVTASEWYVHRRGSPCGNLWERHRDWNWSTAWSGVNDFRTYVRNYIGAYVEAYPSNNEAVSLLISRVREGDVIQFDTRECDTCGWSPAHTVMVATRVNRNNYYLNDVTYNDHSGGVNGADSREASLRGKFNGWGVTNRRRMVWIKMVD